MDDYLYVEARDPEHARVVQSRASMVSTYPASMAHMRFTAATYTAVGASAGDVRLLVRFQRVEDV
jgi:hypothetical protein